MAYREHGGYDLRRQHIAEAEHEFESLLNEILYGHDLQFDLTPPGAATSLRKRMAEVAEEEYLRWKKGAIVEAKNKNSAADNLIAVEALKEYHLFGLSSYHKGDPNKLLTYTDKRADAQVKNIQTGLESDTSYWSAAFISYVVRKAVAGREAEIPFNYSSAHVWYLRKAKRAKEENDSSYPFWAYPIGDAELEVGDILCNGRDSSTGLTYEKIGKKGDASLHCDVITEIDPVGLTACGIGGNTRDQLNSGNNDTVGKKIILLDENRRVIPRTGKYYVAVIKYKGNY